MEFSGSMHVMLMLSSGSMHVMTLFVRGICNKESHIFRLKLLETPIWLCQDFLSEMVMSTFVK